MISRSNLDGNGQEYMSMCVDCRLDSSGVCAGKRICIENNHKQNSYSIYTMIGARYIKGIAKGKGETLELVEFQKYLSEYGYVEDERACKEARESKSNWHLVKEGEGMAYVRCGNHDCEYHNKRMGCALKRVGISIHNKEDIPGGEGGATLENPTYCVSYKQISSGCRPVKGD